jgi:hypothetical protein
LLDKVGLIKKYRTFDYSRFFNKTSKI